MSWNHVVVEGFCFGGVSDENPEHCPCGRSGVSPYCWGRGGEEGICPHFHWAKSDTIEVISFVPLKTILKEKIKDYINCLSDTLTWHLWQRWIWKAPELSRFIPKVQELPAWAEAERQEKELFRVWIAQANTCMTKETPPWPTQQ